MKVIDLDWTYENGVYSLKNEASKDDVIITKDCLVYGYPDYDEEKHQKTHYFLCPPVPGPHHKLRIIKGVIHFSTGWGNLRIIGKNIKSGNEMVERKFVSTKSDYDSYEVIAFDSLDEVNEYLNKREDKGDLEDHTFKKVYKISISQVYHKYIKKYDKWEVSWRTEIHAKNFLTLNDATTEKDYLMGQRQDNCHNTNVVYQRVNDNTVIMRYKDCKHYRTLSYSINEFYIDSGIEVKTY